MIHNPFKPFKVLRKTTTCCILFYWIAQSVFAQPNNQYDIVLQGGRVIDPETKLDAIRNIGIRDGQILEISTNTLSGTEIINVSGLIVAPGFIDLHVHGITNIEQEYQIKDGVTTALELEWGLPFLKEWYALRKSKALINFGASVNWPITRVQSLASYQEQLSSLKEIMSTKGLPVTQTMPVFGKSFYQELPQDKIPEMLDYVQESLKSGGLGISMPIGYLPGASTEEVFRVYQLAGTLKAPVYAHVREGGVIAIQQVISDAVLTRAPLHICHINSMALNKIMLAIEMVNTAQKSGFDITTELYPYTAGSTDLKSAIFDTGWQKKLGMSFKDLQWVATGERLTEETFATYRKDGGTVVMHNMKPEWIASGIASKGMIIASDGMPYAKLAHPRSSGTFSRVLGKYVREDKVIDLTEAIEKITFLPAKRLEVIAPMMKRKGRIQVNADADITVFSFDKIIDKSTFEKGIQPSEGIEYVLVNGIPVLRKGKIVKDTFPGQPVYGKYKE
ncbi:amidohydrolase family protein [Aquimarina mytili]|uniref:D-glutamate deacylase n=1 Tax=Aquimarina mytili TaxID=874423 RepID=A0A937DCR5_9FLAO|nr:amidohydrolase family protein [Aquimarina mytili]MBL0685918.1 D-glutamate deacylase [Aquimarina mytili]